MTTNHIPRVGEDNEAGVRKSTRQLLVKIPNVPCLYRHSVNGTYYAIKKHGGNKKEHSLQVEDRKIAQRKLAEWIKNLGKLDPQAEKTTLAQLITKFETANVGNPDKPTDDSMIKRFKETWPHDIHIHVSRIKPSQLDTWLATECKAGEWKNTTYNKYCTFLRRLFNIATSDKMIAESPMEAVKVPWKKPQKPKRRVPTLDQLAAIVNDIRTQKLNHDAEDSADFVEFEGNAGLGQAEAAALSWEDVDFAKGELSIVRKKTGEPFQVPIYPNLRPLLERLAKKPHKPNDSVFKVADAKKALAGACKRLGYHAFSQRNIRAVQIRRLWQARVDIKLIAKWQGHQDGGRLLLNTYTEVFGDNDADYIKAELSKLE